MAPRLPCTGFGLPLPHPPTSMLDDRCRRLTSVGCATRWSSTSSSAPEHPHGRATCSRRLSRRWRSQPSTRPSPCWSRHGLGWALDPSIASRRTSAAPWASPCSSGNRRTARGTCGGCSRTATRPSCACATSPWPSDPSCGPTSSRPQRSRCSSSTRTKLGAKLRRDCALRPWPPAPAGTARSPCDRPRGTAARRAGTHACTWYR